MDFYRQVFLRKVSENMRKKDESPLFEAVSEYYEKNALDAKNYFSRYNSLRERIAFYKNKVMAGLPDYLIALEQNLSASGAKVLYAETVEDVAREIANIVKPSQKVFLSKNECLDQMGLTRSLKGRKMNLQQVGPSYFPYNILPEPKDKVLHRLQDELRMNELSDGKAEDAKKAVKAEDVLSLKKRKLVNEMFGNAVALTGADFLVCDPGCVVLLENEGTHTLPVSFCKTHIVVAGIDSLVPSLNELEYFTCMLSAHAHGQAYAWSQLLLRGPRQPGEMDGPDEFYLILVDDGRTDVLKKKNQRSVLNCIHCQACTALCPVFKYVNTFDGMPLAGPLNCVVDPIKHGFRESGFLPFACTLCGKCSEVCPSGINFQELILFNRKESVEGDAFFAIERKQMKTLKRMLLKTKSLQSPVSRFSMKLHFKKRFGQQKEFPDFNQKSFRMLWLEKNTENQ
ncbi:MAG: LUD domain-containing protein [Bacteroides sp.]|nr:LUD domain-containing protein [Ruminococcus flavefaciens]MCM1554198.1 LUD domain-containing protein [Bacteroides sp.]